MKFILKINPLLLIILLLFVNIALTSLWILKHNSGQIFESSKQEDNYPEISQLVNKNLSFSELKIFFQDLANKKGAPYAYEMLKVAPIPKGTDMHLMGHVVGEILYKQQGANGIKVCTEDFRNACSHTIVVGLLMDKGEGALVEISKACKEAPGGSGAYTMCYHGLGHGVLSYSDFDVKKAISICEKVQKAGFSEPEAVQCVSGAIMEIISGGDHDKETWAKMRKVYLRDSDPIYPCNSDFMPGNARPMCYLYLTPHLFLVAGADLGSPQPEHFKKAFTYCSEIPKEDSRNFKSCYGGFGKEFVVLAAGRDIRMAALGSIEKNQFKKVYDWCMLADNQEGIRACIENATNSYYWGGENKPEIAIGFCSAVEDENFQQSCFRNFIYGVGYYIQDQNYRKNICNLVPSRHNQTCQQILVSN